MRKLLLALLLLPQLAFGIDYEANVKALTPTIWTKGYYGNTVSLTTLGVSATKDFSGNSRTFTQGVAANQPLTTRQDNRENLVRGPSDERLAFSWTSGARFTWTGYTTSPTGVANSASIFVEDNTNGAHYTYPTTSTYDISYIGGQQYRVGYYVKTIVGSRNWSLSFPDGIRTLWNSATCTFISKTEASGVVNSTSCTPAGGGWYYIEMVITPAASGTGSIYFYPYDNLTVNYLGDGVSSQAIWGPRIQAVAADTNYLLPQPFSHYRGVSWLPALHFDGSNDSMDSTAILSNIISASGADVFFVVRSNATAGDQMMFQDIGSQFIIYLSNAVPQFKFRNTDAGGADTLLIPATLTSTNILRVWHGGGNIGASLNNVPVTPIASGDTANLTQVLKIGGSAGAGWLNADLVEFIAFNSKLSDANAQTVYDYLTWTLTNPWKRIEVTP